MPTRALHMREIRELIRLKYESGRCGEQMSADASDHQGVVAKYVVRIERTGLGSDVLMSMADVEGMAGIVPASRPAS